MTSKETFKDDIQNLYRRVKDEEDSISQVLDFIFSTGYKYAYEEGSKFLSSLRGGFSSSNVREAIGLIFKYLDNPTAFKKRYGYSDRYTSELLDALAYTLSDADDFFSNEQYAMNFECLTKIWEKTKSYAARRVREFLAKVLGELGQGREDDKIVDALIEALQKDQWVRQNAVKALGELGQGREDDEIVDALIEVLQKDQERSVRLEALRALSQLGPGREDDKKIVDALIKALQEDEDIRLWAIRALLQIELDECREDDEIVDALIGALGWDEDKDVRYEAANALGKIGVDRVRRGLDPQKIIKALSERMPIETTRFVADKIKEAIEGIQRAESVIGLRKRKKLPEPKETQQLAGPVWDTLWSDFEKLARGENLIYGEDEAKKYHYALWANLKPGNRRHFVILAGPSGTGKTKLAQVYAAALLGCESLEELNGHPQFCLVAVRPEWTDSRDLLGYLNPITGKYQSTPALSLLLSAEKNRNKPHLLILDEMNIAHVEYYFSDFLSGMESGAEITLHHQDDGNEIPQKIRIPPNLFVTGTINVDETTHEISPKVLDRAYVLVLDANWNLYYERSPLKEERDLGWAFSELMSEGGAIRRAAEILKEAGLGFGYRTVEEIIRYVAKANIPMPEALDHMFVSKILPKIRGSETGELRKALEALMELAKDLPETRRHLEKMSSDLEAKGFVKFTPI